MPKNIIAVKGLYHSYTKNNQYAVKDINFDIAEGEIFGFLGPSGAGKSTVQNIMTGLLGLQTGEVLYAGQSIKDVQAAFYNQIGVSFEHPNLYSKLTALENLIYHAGLYDVPTEDPMTLLEMVDLRESANKKASNFSKGMKQRLVFARALINNPNDLNAFNQLVASKRFETIHSQEATLEQIFIKLTGRGLE